MFNCQTILLVSGTARVFSASIDAVSSADAALRFAGRVAAAALVNVGDSLDVLVNDRDLIVATAPQALGVAVAREVAA